MKLITRFYALFILFLCVSLCVPAQEIKPLPKDPAVRHGVLDNGLTYYIRANKYPENQADFYIAQKVGSMQEEDSQMGLAHFLEHMAFNGTKHFPGRKTMMDYLEKNGAKFGANVNAYTSFDETVYNLTNIPLTRTGILDSCLLILHDWSGFLTLDDKEIDQERGIIKEEWRTRNNAQSRTWDKLLPIMFEGSKYANRMPIGTMEVVENFAYDELRNYYHKWYRPDLQGIVIVGDFDADKVEKKVKTLFSDIPKAQNPAERIYHPVPDNKEPIIAIASDPEATSTRVTIYSKHDVVPSEIKNSMNGMLLSILENFASGLLSARFEEISQKSNSPFLAAGAYDEDYMVSKTKSAWTVAAICKEDSIMPAFAAILREDQRALKYGFLESEVDRMKENLLQGYENAYNNRNKERNDRYASEYVRCFIDDEPFPGIETEFEMVKQLMEYVSADMVSQYLETVDSNENMVITINGPEKEGLTYPSKDEILSLMERIKKEELIAYSENVSDEPLISDLPAPGKIVKRETSDSLATAVWTLSNGVKVILKNTDFKDDQILINSVSYGGTSLFEDADVWNMQLISLIPSWGGLGNFNATDLQKKLAGKSASASPYVSETTQGISASSNKKDLEIAMQLIYLTSTSPHKDADAFNAFMSRLGTNLKNARLQPNTIFSDSISKTLYGNNPRMQRMKEDDLSKIDYDRILEMYKECFTQTAPPTFTFVGNIDEEVLAALVEQYLAILPVGSPDRKYVERDNNIKAGNIINHFDQKMETPKVSVLDIYSGVLPRNEKNIITAGILNQILDLVYTRTIREEEGGTYGVGSSVGIARIPEGRTTLSINFNTDTEKVAELNKIAARELVNIAENGPTEEDFGKTIEYLVKNHKDRIKTNGYWLSVLSAKYFYDEDNYTTYIDALTSITPDDVKNLTKELLSQKNYIEVIMSPIEDKE